MDTFSMKCFLCVAKRLNLSKAADTMGISQPAMSAQIKKMELELGVPLFVRDTHTVYLTPEGETVRAHFQQVLPDYEKLTEELERQKIFYKKTASAWSRR